MPSTKKKRLADLLTIRGKTMTDGTNNSNQLPSRFNNRDDLDAPLKKVPRDVSPDMHHFFEEDRKRKGKSKRSPQAFT